MAVVVQHRRFSTSALRLAYTPAQGEIVVDDTDYAVYVGDGATAGGLLIGAGSFVMASKIANYAVLASDNGTHFDNIGASGTVIFTLPAAARGLNFEFLVSAAFTIEILCAGTDKIAIGGTNSAGGGNAQSAAPFNTLAIESHAAGQWVSRSATGSWTVT